MKPNKCASCEYGIKRYTDYGNNWMFPELKKEWKWEWKCVNEDIRNNCKASEEFIKEEEWKV
jgi:hypothetical protein